MQIDARISKLAENILKNSVQLKKGEKIYINEQIIYKLEQKKEKKEDIEIFSISSYCNYFNL